MSIEKFVPWTAGLVCLGLAACSGGGGGGSDADAAIVSAVQDLTLDPDGLTTVVTLDHAVTNLELADFEANGGQDAVDFDIAGTQVTIEWDARVTPSHQVRIPPLGIGFTAVTTSDSAVPTFAITDADQIAGLGNDTITAQFSGPRVVESEAEDIGNWTLEVDGEELDLTGSTFSLNTAAQTLTITTGDLANLHASFTLTANALHSVADVVLPANAHNGAATGDSIAPTLLSVEQNLAVDEYGRTIDVTFSEAMDPVFSHELSSFSANAPDLSIIVVQPAEDVLRVTFNNPMVPGLDSIDLSGLVDAHGNSFVDQNTAIAAGSTVANDWASDPTLTAVANQGEDTIVAVVEQAFDPDHVEDASYWSLTIDPSGSATVVDLSTARIDYDFVAKTLTLTFDENYDFDFGDDFTFAANPGNPPIDVDGENFLGTFDGQVGGDATAPLANQVKQKRGVDHTGKTVDVVFNEDLDEASAETISNWSLTGVNVLSATLQPDLSTVRLVLDDVAVPGDATLGGSGVEDLAGNTMTALVAHAITSSDTTAPTMTSVVATAVEGDDNDILVIGFSDAMVEDDVEDVANWTVESPVGSTLDISAATIDYRSIGRFALVTLGAGTNIDLAVGAGFRITLAAMRDVGGNAIVATPNSGTVDGEHTLPSVVTAWVESAALNTLHVRFDEPCQYLDDIAGLSEYVVRDNTSAIRGYPTGATVDSDSLGVELVYGFAIQPGSDTLDVHGVLDLAGNPLFPADGVMIEVEDAQTIAFDTGFSTLTTVTGEHNDAITVVFDKRPNPWRLLDPANYSVTVGPTVIDLESAHMSYDGDRTVTIVLDAVDSQSMSTGTFYDLAIYNLQSAQGVALGGGIAENVMAAGDSSAPTLPIGGAKLDAADPTHAVLVEMSEALDPADAIDPALVLLNGVTVPDELELLGFRTIRATFSGGVSTSDTIDVTLRDLAGNLGVATRAITTPDATGPLVVQVSGTAVSGSGGDVVTVVYDEQVDLVNALSAGSYTVTNGVAAVDLTNAQLRWDSSANTVTIHLADGVALDPTQTLNVQVANVYDHAGLVMTPPANVFGSVAGDSSAPDFDAAFVNYRADSAGTLLDVLFDEDVDAAFVGAPFNWNTSGPSIVIDVEHVEGRWWRATLNTTLGSGETVQMSGVPDCAGNTSGAIAVAPAL